MDWGSRREAPARQRRWSSGSFVVADGKRFRRDSDDCYCIGKRRSVKRLGSTAWPRQAWGSVKWTRLPYCCALASAKTGSKNPVQFKSPRICHFLQIAVPFRSHSKRQQAPQRVDNQFWFSKQLGSEPCGARRECPSGTAERSFAPFTRAAEARNRPASLEVGEASFQLWTKRLQPAAPSNRGQPTGLSSAADLRLRQPCGS